MAYFNELYSGTKSLFIGMGITIREFFKPVVTLQYPHESLQMSARFRGHIELVRDLETGGNKCIVCGLCEKNCPSACISLEGEKREGVKGKVLTRYTLDFTKCSLCGMCVENCKPGAIQFSKDYNLAGPSRAAYVFDLLKRLEGQK